MRPFPAVGSTAHQYRAIPGWATQRRGLLRGRGRGLTHHIQNEGKRQQQRDDDYCCPGQLPWLPAVPSCGRHTMPARLFDTPHAPPPAIETPVYLPVEILHDALSQVSRPAPPYAGGATARTHSFRLVLLLSFRRSRSGFLQSFAASSRNILTVSFV